MSGLYASVLVAHVVIAVLGLGSVASVAVLASTANRSGRSAADFGAWLNPLLRYSAFSLAAMLATGIVLDLVASGSFRRLWWFRGSAILLVAAGILNGRARRALRALALTKVAWTAYAICALVAAIIVLMEVKPF